MMITEQVLTELIAATWQGFHALMNIVLFNTQWGHIRIGTLAYSSFAFVLIKWIWNWHMGREDRRLGREEEKNYYRQVRAMKREKARKEKKVSDS